jgi:hypothetical protein
MKKLQVKGSFFLKDKGRFFKVITVKPIGEYRYVFGCRELCSEKSEVLSAHENLSLEDLAKTAEILARPVFYTTEGGEHSFYIIDNNTKYQYKTK